MSCPVPVAIDGGAEEDRTPDLSIANATLSQLSYGPTLFQPYNQRFKASRRIREIINQGYLMPLASITILITRESRSLYTYVRYYSSH